MSRSSDDDDDFMLARIKEKIESMGGRMVAGGRLPKADRSDVATPPSIDPDIQAERLRDNYAALIVRHAFKPGEIAMLKPGLSGQWRIPGDGQPVLITELLDPPMIDPHAHSGQPTFMRKHDLVIMLIDGEGDVVEFAFDSRYLQPYGDANV